MLLIIMLKRKLEQLMSRLFMLTFLMFASLSVAQASPPALFGDTHGTVTSKAWTAPASVGRSRNVSVNTDLLVANYGTMKDIQTNPEVTLNLFDDANFTGVITSVEKTADGYSWVGKIKGQAQSYFYMLTVKDAFILHVASASDGIYEVSSAGNGLYRVIKIDQSKFVDHPEGTVIEQKLYPSDLLQKDNLSPNADAAGVIDIMVVYTAAALAGEGSETAMKARIALAVLETNQSYIKSGVTRRLRLVHIEQVVYTESGDIFVDVTRLAGTTDGYMDNVHALRNTYAADMVGLIVENGGGYCGVASAIMADAASAFQLSQRECATGYYSFGHEFGHLQGARHDVYVDPSTTPYTYGHGYVHTGTTTATRWRTVMAYNNKCSDLGYNCTRLQFWSNPAKLKGGAPMGNSVSKNFKVLNTTALTVANFRTALISGYFYNNFNANHAGWTPVTGTWSLANASVYRTHGLENLNSSIKRSGTYGDVTYEVKMRRFGSDLTVANKLFVRGNPSSLGSTNNWNSSYQFNYTANGDFGVFKIDGAGATTTLAGWTAHTAIVQGSGSWNKLKVVAVGSSLKFYINSVLVWSGVDTSLQTGSLGIDMYSSTTGGVGATNKLDVDWATASTTPTADALLDEHVVSGRLVGGNNPNKAP